MTERLLNDLIGILLLVFTIATIFVVRISNPQYTEIQLFVYFTPIWWLCAVLVSVAYTLITFKRKDTR